MATRSSFPDEKAYLLLSESLNHGIFSTWYFLSTPVPDTLRTWGYPFFLFLSLSVLNNLTFVKVIQYTFYLASLWTSVRIIRQLTPSTFAINSFLLVSMVNIQIPYYSGLIAAESLCIFFTLLYFHYIVSALSGKLRFWEISIWSAIAFANFQLRPAFIVIPFVTAIFFVIRSYKQYGKVVAIHVVLFLVSLLPFAYWNLKHHHVFKFTPLQGGAGVSHIGYWSYLLPANYSETFLWSNNVGDDVFMNLVAERSPQHAIAFEQEWVQIRSSAAAFLTRSDSLVLGEMNSRNPGIFVTYNSEYTRAQESLLWHYTAMHIKERPLFYLKTRVISFCRVWFTGINRTEWLTADGLPKKLIIILPFALTFTFIFGGIIYIATSIVSRREMLQKYGIIFGLIIVWGAIHSIFAIQARYGVPMHFLVLILTICLLLERNVGSKPMKLKPTG